MTANPMLTVAQSLQSADLLGRLAYENAAMIDQIELLTDGSFRLVVGTFDAAQPNEADIWAKLSGISGLQVSQITFYEKVRGCAPGGSGCPTKSSGGGGGCGSGGCGSGGCKPALS